MSGAVTPEEREAVVALLRKCKGKAVLKEQVEQARANLKHAGLIWRPAGSYFFFVFDDLAFGLKARHKLTQ